MNASDSGVFLNDLVYQSGHTDEYCVRKEYHVVVKGPQLGEHPYNKLTGYWSEADVHSRSCWCGRPQ